MSPDWATGYVGIPYLSLGRTREGCDCWGLVRLVYAEHFSIDLPSFKEAYESANDVVDVSGAIEVERNSERWKSGWAEVKSPAPGDVILCRVMGYETHVGVFAGAGLMLHVLKGTDACIVNTNSMMWKRRIVGYFRQSVGMPSPKSL